MSKEDQLVAWVIDRSGSMGGVVEATVKGFNTFTDSQRDVPGETLVSLLLFDDRMDLRFGPTDIKSVNKMTSYPSANHYFVRGGTALYDGVGTTVKGIENWLSKHPFDGRINVITLTDGFENSSTHWRVNPGGVKDGDDRDLLGLIQWKQKEGWEFTFMGSGGAQWLEKTFSPVVDQTAFYATVDHNDFSTQSAYAGVSRSMRSARAGGQSLNSVLTNDASNQYVSSTTSTSTTATPEPPVATKPAPKKPSKETNKK